MSGLDELTPELRSEIEALTAELPDVELRYAAAVTSEATDAAAAAIAEQDGGESTEKRALLRRAKLAHYIKASIDQRGVDPASVEGELAAAYGCPGFVPLEVFGPVETRDITPAPDTGNAQQQAAPLPNIFKRSIGDFLGVSMPTVATGAASFPVLSTSVTSAPKAKGAPAPATAGVYTPHVVTPKRITGSIEITREDQAVMIGLEASLRSDLGSSMTDQYNDQLLNGDGTSPNLNGLLAQLTDPPPSDGRGRLGAARRRVGCGDRWAARIRNRRRAIACRRANLPPCGGDVSRYGRAGLGRGVSEADHGRIHGDRSPSGSGEPYPARYPPADCGG